MKRPIWHLVLVVMACLALTIPSLGDSVNAQYQAQDVERSQKVEKDLGIEIHQPPITFDPEKATDEELSYYNYPSRPAKGTPEYDLWLQLVKAKWERPTFEKKVDRKSSGTFKKAGSDASTFSSHKWSGVVSNGTYDDVKGWWKAPFAYADTTHRPAYSAQWVGLGGYAVGAPLIQAGTNADVYTNGSGGYAAWYEIVGTNRDTGSMVAITNFAHTQGDQMYAELWFTVETNGTGTAHFYIADTTLGTSKSWSVTGMTGYQGLTSSAEWIVEKPVVAGLDTYYLTKPYYSGSDSGLVHWTYCQKGTRAGGLTYVSATATSTDFIYMLEPNSQYFLQDVPNNTIGSSGDFDTRWLNH